MRAESDPRKHQWERATELFAALALGSAAGLCVLAGLFVFLIYAGLSARQAFVLLNNPTMFASQLAAGLLAGMAWESIRVARTRSRLTRSAAGVLIGFCIAYNFLYGVRFGFLFALLALIVGGCVGVGAVWVAYNLFQSQLRVLGRIWPYLGVLLGAMSVYVAVTLLFAVLFYLVGARDPAAFSCPTCTAAVPGRTDFIYFSIMTITTLGSGDLKPVSGLARLLTSVEVVIGALVFVAYLGVVVAHVTESATKRAG